MRTERIRTALLATMVAIFIAMSPAQLASATPGPTDPTDPPIEEPAPEEPADSTPADSGEPAPEPGEVPPAVWVGVAALVVLAVVWAVRQAPKSSSSEEP
jgi:hypothetical protein